MTNPNQICKTCKGRAFIALGGLSCCKCGQFVENCTCGAIAKFSKCKKYGLSTLADLEAGKVEQALVKAEKKSYEAGRKNGRQDQLIIITNLFNDLRNKRFQFNDEVKMVIDMLKDEITRVSK
jgi:predicted molibdopterin-dependent oxidoreductase YjgC